jgi:rsbT co-antagonist protein RsbR
MWHSLNLRARILTGYACVLVLSGTVAGFLMLRIGDVNRQIAAVNASVAADARIGIQVTSDVALAQQAVNRYLQDPQDKHWVAANAALDRLEQQVTDGQRNLSSRSVQLRLGELQEKVRTYREGFQRVSNLIQQKESLRERLSLMVFQVESLTGNVIADSFVIRRGGAETVRDLLEAQQSLEIASMRITRLVSDEDEQQGVLTVAELRKAHGLLERSAGRPSPSTAVQEAVRSVTSAISLTGELSQTIEDLQLARALQLNPRADDVRRSADLIASYVLGALTTATADLERQVYQTQQVAGGALVATVLTALLVGLRLARNLAQPLVELAGAVERVDDGDYDVTASERDGGEIGRLATAFNRMTATLRRQRAEVTAQQEAMAERNRELEQAFESLRAATEEREQLASAVRAISVPVVPILRDVIVVPLVGEIDAERSLVLQQRLLDGITSSKAQIVILDITGVPFVDAELAGRLLQATTAAELLGARCILVGVSPEVAQALVMTGADLKRIATRADLRAGVEYAMQVTAARALAR